MNNYLNDTSSAVIGIIELLNKEEKSLTEKQEELVRLKESALKLNKSMKENVHSMTIAYDLLGTEQACDRFAKEIDEVSNLISNLIPTYNTLAGALLQIAKQGISCVYSRLSNCPDGRAIGTNETLKNVIWQARNQSMHYEEANFSQSVVRCFNNLKNDFGDDFHLDNQNLAYSIIKILGWNSYKNYKNDMMSLFSVTN